MDGDLCVMEGPRRPGMSTLPILNPSTPSAKRNARGFVQASSEKSGQVCNCSGLRVVQSRMSGVNETWLVNPRARFAQVARRERQTVLFVSFDRGLVHRDHLEVAITKMVPFLAALFPLPIDTGGMKRSALACYLVLVDVGAHSTTAVRWRIGDALQP